MSLLFRDESFPDTQVFLRPLVGPGLHDIVGHNVNVPKVRNDGYGPFIGRVRVVLLAKDLLELVYQQLVRFNNLLFCSRYLLIGIMAGRVSCPNDEVDGIFDVVVDPLKGRIY